MISFIFAKDDEVIDRIWSGLIYYVEVYVVFDALSWYIILQDY